MNVIFFFLNVVAACNTQGLMGTVVSSTPAPAINHLLLNKSTSTSLKLPKNQKTTVPVSRAVQRLKESSSVSLGMVISISLLH